MGQLARLVACVGVAVLVLAGCGNGGGGDAKVKVADIEGQALAKLKDVLQIPQNVSAVFVGAPSDPRQTRQDLDRLAAKTGVVTLPGNP